ncbi:hypothetical protein IE53DRAFT_234708 [Violaceomyces palustris]|uniref:Uncharacterized protein n=1 Tax=Violaceomyces palustris TaxID=1673888 RepID=A0ACD0P4D2_9BASI|nr:hypothetical protein IE53DRAFT_234708 [Violaceomyces palustris]
MKMNERVNQEIKRGGKKRMRGPSPSSQCRRPYLSPSPCWIVTHHSSPQLLALSKLGLPLVYRMMNVRHPTGTFSEDCFMIEGEIVRKRSFFSSRCLSTKMKKKSFERGKGARIPVIGQLRNRSFLVLVTLRRLGSDYSPLFVQCLAGFCKRKKREKKRKGSFGIEFAISNDMLFLFSLAKRWLGGKTRGDEVWPTIIGEA